MCGDTHKDQGQIPLLLCAKGMPTACFDTVADLELADRKPCKRGASSQVGMTLQEEYAGGQAAVEANKGLLGPVRTACLCSHGMIKGLTANVQHLK